MSHHEVIQLKKDFRIVNQTAKHKKKATIKLLNGFPVINMWEADSQLNETLDICNNMVSIKKQTKKHPNDILNKSYPSLTTNCEGFINEPFKDLKNSSIKSIACKILKDKNVIVFNYEIYDEKRNSYKRKQKAFSIKRNTICEELSNEYDSDEKTINKINKSNSNNNLIGDNSKVNEGIILKEYL